MFCNLEEFSITIDLMDSFWEKLLGAINVIPEGSQSRLMVK
jgi:hypothetical protein